MIDATKAITLADLIKLYDDYFKEHNDIPKSVTLTKATNISIFGSIYKTFRGIPIKTV